MGDAVGNRGGASAGHLRAGLCELLKGADSEGAGICLVEKLVELSPDPVLAMNCSLEVVAANASALRLFDTDTRFLPLSAQDLLGREAARRIARLFISSSKTATACFRAELAGAARGQEISVTAHRLIDDRCETVGVAVCLHQVYGASARDDMSHPRKIEALGLYAAGVIHEFNNILAVIAGRASIGLLADGPLARERALQNVVKAAQRAEHVVKDLLVYVEKQQPEFLLANLKSVVLEAISLLSMELASGYVEVSHQLDEIPPLMCDPVQISQVCFNLIQNAKEAMPEGGALEITLRKRGGWAVITISDTGVGVPPEYRSRVFDPFVSCGKSRSGRSPCAGLGLFVAREIVLSHGGDISLESVVAKGSTFTVCIPLTPNRPDAEDRPDEGASIESHTSVLS